MLPLTPVLLPFRPVLLPFTDTGKILDFFVCFSLEITQGRIYFILSGEEKRKDPAKTREERS